MTAKIATPKTATPQVKAELTVRKAGTKKALAATVATKSPKIIAVKEKKAKKIKQPGSKPKIVRDSFSMPQNDYAKIDELKKLCLKNGVQVKKSQLLRAGLHALGKLSAAQLKTALTALEKVESGRAKKD